MIAKLAGVVEQIEPDAAVIDVGGVGYLAFCSTRTIGRLPPAARLSGAPADRDAHVPRRPYPPSYTPGSSGRRRTCDWFLLAV